jgi:putative ABC transport system substrate-binding protein
MGQRHASAQTSKRHWRIGYLIPADPVVPAGLMDALRQLGYGDSISFDVRAAEGDFSRLPGLAAALVDAQVDVIMAVSPPAIVAASRATKTIPIVMAFWGGPGLIESGVIASFAKPGGNVTGIYMLAAELEAKRLEILLQAQPSARRIAVLNPGPEGGDRLAELLPVAQAAGVELYLTDVPGSKDYEPIFQKMAASRTDAVLVPSSPRFYLESREIIAAAARHRIPAMYEWGELARAGGMIAYGPILADLFRSSALYVDRILKGAAPGSIPVEQPTKFELVVNLATAGALGITIPQSLLLRADDVIR